MSKVYAPITSCLVIIIVALSLLLQSCTQNHVSSAAFQKNETVVSHRIAIFPIQRIDLEETADHAYRCPICGTIITAGILESQGEKVVEEVFLQMLDKSGKFEFVPPERVNGVFQRISAGSLKTSLKEVLVRSGRELGADAIMYGYVYRFRERKGYAYGTDQAASVAFAVHLIRVRDGSLIWKGLFDKTQMSLMENVLHIFSFYKERGRWLTARELTEEGVVEILETFPGWQ